MIAPSVVPYLTPSFRCFLAFISSLPGSCSSVNKTSVGSLLTCGFCCFLTCTSSFLLPFSFSMFQILITFLSLFLPFLAGSNIGLTAELFVGPSTAKELVELDKMFGVPEIPFLNKRGDSLCLYMHLSISITLAIKLTNWGFFM